MALAACIPKQTNKWPQPCALWPVLRALPHEGPQELACTIPRILGGHALSVPNPQPMPCPGLSRPRLNPVRQRGRQPFIFAIGIVPGESARAPTRPVVLQVRKGVRPRVPPSSHHPEGRPEERQAPQLALLPGVKGASFVGVELEGTGCSNPPLQTVEGRARNHPFQLGVVHFVIEQAAIRGFSCSEIAGPKAEALCGHPGSHTPRGVLEKALVPAKMIKAPVAVNPPRVGVRDKVNAAIMQPVLEG